MSDVVACPFSHSSFLILTLKSIASFTAWIGKRQWRTSAGWWDSCPLSESHSSTAGSSDVHGLHALGGGGIPAQALSLCRKFLYAKQKSLTWSSVCGSVPKQQQISKPISMCILPKFSLCNGNKSLPKSKMYSGKQTTMTKYSSQGSMSFIGISAVLYTLLTSLWILSFFFNRKNGTDEPSCRAGIERLRCGEWTCGCSRGGEGGMNADRHTDIHTVCKIDGQWEVPWDTVIPGLCPAMTSSMGWRGRREGAPRGGDTCILRAGSPCAAETDIVIILPLRKI